MARLDPYLDVRPLMPDYTVKYYREGFYKLVRFHRPIYPMPREESPEEASESETEGKLSQAYSRAKSVVQQLGLCNDWPYFITVTINKEKHDRYDLNAYYKRFAQWIRDYRKEYNCRIEYLFVPEKHEDGAWHMHGFIKGIPEDHLTPFVFGKHPTDLVNGGYLNWGRYAAKFGYCSLGRVRDPIATAFYVSKYVTKAFDRGVTAFGAHLYYASIGLARAVHAGDVYGRYYELDKLLTSEHEFCSTGWVKDVDWVFWCDFVSMDWVDFGEQLAHSDDPNVGMLEISPEWEQLDLFEQMDLILERVGER